MIFDKVVLTGHYLNLVKDIDYILVNSKRIQIKMEAIFKKHYIKYRSDNTKWYKSPVQENEFIRSFMGYYTEEVNNSELYSMHKVDVPAYKVFRTSYTKFMNRTVDVLCSDDLSDYEFEFNSLANSSPLFDYEFIKFVICLKKYSTVPPVFDFEELTYSMNISKYANEMRKILGD